MWANLVSEFTAGFYVSATLNSSLGAFVNDSLGVLRTGDIWHGIGKAGLFGVLIALVAVVNGSSVTGGAEGVGRVTTRSVVQAITAIVVSDMVIGYLSTH
jgi:phospholipid/cholesterol/gamma-HCH transport system permease protein